MNDLKKQLDSYQVTILPLSDEDGGGFKAHYKELALSVCGYGATQAEALADLEDLALDGLADEDPTQLPAPHGEVPWADSSGRITLRVPKMLHAKVARQADEQGVSLNQWICHILESATSVIDAGLEFGAATPVAPTIIAEIESLRETIDGWAISNVFDRDSRPPVSSPRRKSSLTYQHLELHVA